MLSIAHAAKTLVTLLSKELVMRSTIVEGISTHTDRKQCMFLLSCWLYQPFIGPEGEKAALLLYHVLEEEKST